MDYKRVQACFRTSLDSKCAVQLDFANSISTILSWSLSIHNHNLRDRPMILG